MNHLSKAERLEWSKNHQINSDYFDKIDAETKAYWLGFIYADGNVTKNKDVFNLNLQMRDKDHLQKFANIFGKSLKERKGMCRGKSCPESVVRVCSRYFCASLISKGIIPRKTYIDSDVFCHIPEHLMRHFIRGNMDGDGCICRFMSCGKVRYHVDFLGRVKFINELRAILERQFLGEQFYTVPYQSICRLSVSYAPTIERLLTWLYSDATVYLERKHERYVNFKREMCGEAGQTGKRKNRDDSAIVKKAWATRKAA